MTRHACVLLLLLTACPGPREQVVLLPGGTEPLTLTTVQGQTMTLHAAYETAQARAGGRLEAGRTTAESVQTRYGAVLGTTPQEGRRWTLRFDTGQATLEPESQAEVPALLEAIAGRAAVEVLIEGHTDTVGDMASNDRLSAERAMAVRDLLVTQGLRASFVRIVGRGERALAVDTPDETDEPANRRVEVLVR